MIAAVASVALVLGAGLGVLLFGATRKRAVGAGDALPGNAALGGGATGDMSSLAADGPMAGATAGESAVDAGDWFATRAKEDGGAGGADNDAGEHVPTDLAPGAARPDRAVDAFRPDRDAAVLPAERDAFAPATRPVPSRIEAMGNGDED